MISSGLFLWLTMIGFVVTVFAGVATKVLQGFSRHKLEEYCLRRQRTDLFDEILEHDEATLPGVEAIRILGTVLMLLAAIGWTQSSWSLAHLHEIGGFLKALFVATLVLFASNVWLPWPVVQLWAAPFLFHTWPIWRFTAILMRPIALGSQLVGRLGQRLAGRTHLVESEEDAFEEEIRSMVTEGLKEGHLEEDARDMIEGVIDLHDADVADVMTPRSDIQAMPYSLPWQEMLKFVSQARRTRVPVFGKNLDDIVGVLYAKDLLTVVSNEVTEETDWHPLLRKPWFVPRTHAIDDLLQDFLGTHNHMAIVVDEYKGVAGLVTIEDVLEEIVGEIVDESDEVVETDLKELPDGSLEANARIHLTELAELRGLNLPEDEEFDTIGGLLISQLGRIPEVGQQLQYRNIVVTVLEANQRSVQRVRIEVVEGNHSHSGSS